MTKGIEVKCVLVFAERLQELSELSVQGVCGPVYEVKEGGEAKGEGRRELERMKGREELERMEGREVVGEGRERGGKDDIQMKISISNRGTAQ